MGSYLFFCLVGVEISNQLTLTPFEIESIFSSFKEEKSNKIHSEHFSKLLSELEKVINHFYVQLLFKILENFQLLQR